MCLRFVFLLITHVAAWLRLSRRDDAWKTAEILILRHQLAVLQRRRPCRPRLNWTDRALLAVIPKARRRRLRLLVAPDTVLRWHRDIVRRRRAARSAHARPAGRRPGGTSRPWPAGWPARTPTGDTGGSTANWLAWALTPPPRPCGRSSRPAASTPAGGGPGRPGRSSCGPRPRRSWRGLLHGPPARRHPGLCPGRDRARDPARPRPRGHPASHRAVDRPAGPQPDHGPRRTS